MYSAVLDTCALWSSIRRDFLLSLAAEGLYRPLWNAELLDELQYEEARKLVDRGFSEVDAEAQAARLIAAMGTFDDALVEGWEPLAGSYGLPDPDDEHVLASAVMAGAGCIVTFNLKDFPADRVPNGIEVLTPHAFAANAVAVAPELGLHAVVGMAKRRSTSVDLILERLEKSQQMNEAVGMIRGEQ